MNRLRLVLGLACLAAARPVAAQPPEAGALQLARLQQAAIDADPRLRQLTLQQMQSTLRLGNLAAERLPSIATEGLTQYQSDVATPPSIMPGGQPLFSPLKSTYDAYLRVDQRVFDPTIRSRMAVERAQLAESQAHVRVSLFALRQEVNDAFFAAAVLQERAGALRASIASLERRLEETAVRVREGAALPADAAAVEATLLRRRQDDLELRIGREAALSRLSALTGRVVTPETVLEVPDLRAAVATARRTTDPTRSRPEYEQFSRARDRLSRQQDAVTAQARPRVSAFARVGYGRPGLNFISDHFDTYGLVGVQVHWKPWTWGTESREREALSIQAQIIAADEAAFTRTVERATDGDARTIDRLAETLSLDDRIVTLRESVDRSTEVRFRENAVTSSEYLDRSTELLDARFAQAAHRVELAQASATFLTTLGLEVR